jgi:hypothetical protein
MIYRDAASQGKAAITSDKWHVVHSHFKGGARRRIPFARTIITSMRTRGL